jgi:hypothetical protein
MFIRGRERESEVWHRFRLPVEGFVAGERDGLFEARIVANASWSIDLFLALSERLSARIGLALEDARTGRRWHGDAVLLPHARDAIVQLRNSLMVHAGLECALFDTEDQITLTRHLEVFIYARTERWFYFLRDLGLRRYRFLAPRSWRLADDEFPPAPVLDQALTEVVERLALIAG